MGNPPWVNSLGAFCPLELLLGSQDSGHLTVQAEGVLRLVAFFG